MNVEFYLSKLSQTLQNGITVKDSVWQILAVLVTGSAVLVALLPTIRNWLKRPKLKMIFVPDKPYLRVEFSRSVTRISNKYIYVSIRVKNHGRETAKACNAKLLLVTHNSLPIESKYYKPFSAIRLKWLLSTEEIIHKTDIKPYDNEFFTFELIEKDNDICFQALDGNNSFFFDKKSDGAYYFTFAVYSDNADPVFETLKFIPHLSEETHLYSADKNEKDRIKRQLSRDLN